MTHPNPNPSPSPNDDEAAAIRRLSPADREVYERAQVLAQRLGIDGLSAYAYSHGTDPLDHAIQAAQTSIDIYLTVVAARYENPECFPGYDPEPSIEKTARQIIGRLLDAGWTPPTIKETV